MQFTLSKSNLTKLASKAHAASDPKGTAAIMRMTKIDVSETSIRFAGQCHSTHLVTSLDAETDPAHTGSILVNGGDFLERIRRLGDGSIKLATKDGKLTMKNGERSIVMPCDDVRDWPALQDEMGDALNIDVKALFGVMRDVENAMGVGKSDRSWALCVKVETGPGFVRAVATDGYRVHVSKADAACTAARDFIIPTPTVRTLLSVGADFKEAKLSASSKFLRIETGDTVMFGRLIEEPFPDWTRFFQFDAATTATVSRLELAQAVQAVYPVDAKFGRARIHVSPETGITISATGEGSEARDRLEASVSGPEITFGINGSYLMQALESCDASERVDVLLSNSRNPVVLRGGAVDCLLLPVVL